MGRFPLQGSRLYLEALVSLDVVPVVRLVVEDSEQLSNDCMNG